MKSTCWMLLPVCPHPPRRTTMAKTWLATALVRTRHTPAGMSSHSALPGARDVCWLGNPEAPSAAQQSTEAWTGWQLTDSNNQGSTRSPLARAPAPSRMWFRAIRRARTMHAEKQTYMTYCAGTWVGRYRDVNYVRGHILQENLMDYDHAGWNGQSPALCSR